MSFCNVIQHIFYLSFSVDAIDCYVCTSLDKDNKLCMDGFKKNLATSIYISRKCDFDFFKATHCIKLKGVRGILLFFNLNDHYVHVIIRSSTNYFFSK